MEDHQFNDLSLPEKEALVKEKGQIIDARDFYSFVTISYLVDEHAVRLYYDFSGKLIDVETEMEPEAHAQHVQVLQFSQLSS